ncbi:hypothetical protein BM477_07375 [Boudabousia marimammalium]|uniref:Transport permease protein n=1 Tax=Boudabousia marimammalium TaxID=156892 RepID=A0A1Q5PJZ7_9ACTO|nr:hypothetical protein BM477_07375 [Boudabousia marimammalium]
MATFKALNRVLLISDSRDIATILFTFVVPVIFLVVMVRIFGGFPAPEGGDSVNRVAVNVIAFGLAYVGVFAGATHLTVWRENGMFQVLKAFPISTGSILLSQAFVGAILALIQTLLLVVIALTPWIGVTLAPASILGLVPAVLGYLMFYFIGVLLAVYVPSMAAVSMLANLIIMLLGFVGGAMLPVEFLPQWAQAIAPYSPVFNVRQALYVPMINVGAWSDFWFSFAYLAGVTGLGYLVTRKIFTWK